MNAKNKIVALLEIAIVCSLFLVALPVISAEQNTHEVSAAEVTTTSEDDFVLGIYGNANEDDTIDMRDVTYTKLVIFGKKPETELADAYYDDEVDVLDVVQIKLIILGRESELTIVDSNGEDVTVSMPIERIVVLNSACADAIRVLGAEHTVVGVSSTLAKEEVLLPVMSKTENVGSFMNPDYEAILALNPDIVTAYSMYTLELEEKLEPAGITIVRLDIPMQDFVEEMKKLGYILDNREEAEEFINWHDGYMDEIEDRTEELSEDEKPRVYFEEWSDFSTVGYTSSTHAMCNIAGGFNIAGDYEESYVYVESEWIVEQNPDIIVKIAYSSIPSGYGVDDITGVKAKREAIMSRAGWECIEAVENEDVYLMASDIMHGQYLIGTAWMAKCFQPELFEDFDPQVIHQEYLDRFQRIDYDITEHGVFVYPPLEDWA